MALTDSVLILGIDPSTDLTGVALVQFRPGRAGVVLLTGGLTHDLPRGHKHLAARFARIRQMRRELALFLGDARVDLVAYEEDSRGGESSVSQHQALGAFLSLSHFAHLGEGDILPVSRQEACEAIQVGHVYRERAGATNAEKVAKRARLKAAVIARVNGLFGLCLDAGDDGVADALAVVEAARDIWERAQFGQKPLFGKGSGTKRATKAGKVVA